uniref:Putative tail component n=1 Tax=Siphoviridae sp. ctkI07 TaxID=2825640 RepID=A0A8S5TWG5_9CAUD|nr:MAG TPA: putative tail component [Siphoviridae sp. ctkI07]
MSSIKVTGIDELQMKLKKNVQMSDVKKVVRKNGSDMQKKTQKNAPVDTGTLQRSIALEMRDSGKTAEVEPMVDYGAYVELGTRFMTAQPYLKPAFNEQKEKFKQDMKKLAR